MINNMKIVKTIGTALLLACCVPFTADAARTPYWKQRVSLFDKIPVYPHNIVFLGNSITDGGEFHELLDNPDAVNRGIVGDVISGVKERLHQVTSGHPEQIFLLIGINDVSHGKSAQKIATEYRELVEMIRKESPESELFIQSIMPIDNGFKRYKNLLGREGVIEPLNEELKKIAADNGVTYIDLWPAMCDPKTGKLRKEFTNDGLHLTGNGYKAWAELIKPYVRPHSGIILPGEGGIPGCCEPGGDLRPEPAVEPAPDPKAAPGEVRIDTKETI